MSGQAYAPAALTTDKEPTLAGLAVETNGIIDECHVTLARLFDFLDGPSPKTDVAPTPKSSAAIAIAFDNRSRLLALREGLDTLARKFGAS